MIDELSSLAKRRVEQFHLRHGGECYELDARLWYADGACRDVELLGALVEPPTPRYGERPDRAEYDLAVAKLNFSKAKLAVAVRDFEALKEKLHFSPPADEDAAIKKLTELKTVVEARNEEVRKANALVDATRIGKARKDAQNSPQVQTAKVTNWRNRLKALRI